MTLKWSHLIGCSNKLPQPAALHANIYPTQASAVSVCTLQSTRVHVHGSFCDRCQSVARSICQVNYCYTNSVSSSVRLFVTLLGSVKTVRDSALVTMGS